MDTQKEEGVNTESDEEDKNTGAGVPEGQSRKGNRDPRKKFQWTQEIRSVSEIVAASHTNSCEYLSLCTILNFVFNLRYFEE